MPSQTSSIRLNSVLARQLSGTAKRIKKSKNWIVCKAIEEYLTKINEATLAEEVRRESQRIAERETDDERAWLDHNERQTLLWR